MPRAEWASKAERNRQDQLQHNRQVRQRMLITLQAKRWINAVNKKTLDPEKVVYDPIKREWRRLTDEEILQNKLLKEKEESEKIEETEVKSG